MPARSSSAPSPRNRRSYRLVLRVSPRFKIRALAPWLALIAIIQQVSCGTGNSPAISQFDRTSAITVTISPASAQISPGASVQFLVTVQNASNQAVSWQVNGVPGGNSFFGTIAPSGAATASYTAPASVAATLTVTVKAVLQADATKFGSAIVTVNPPSGPQITISPANSSVVVGASVQFTAAVQNGPPAVIWEVDGLQLGNSSIGSLTSSGFYTAPTKIPTPSVVTITAILVTDSSVSGSTTLTIIPPPISISISPSTANVVTGNTLLFSASVQNSTAGITWEVNGTPGGDSTVGTIISPTINTATYTAPTTVPDPPTVIVSAVLQASPQLSASSGVTIIQPGAFSGVYSWRNDNSLTGQNPQETMLTPATVSSTTKPFGKLFGCPVDGAIFAQPLYVANVAIGGATHNVVYVATENDSVYAFDADTSSCQILWRVTFTDPTLNISAVPASDVSGQADIVPLIGITGTPVIDPATATLYVVAKTKINQGATPSYKQELHALDLATGAEKFNGPAVIQGIVNGTGDGSLSGKVYFDALTENQRAALLLAGGNVYVAFDSYDDTPTFHGWLFAYDAANLNSAPVAFISTPNGSNGGIGESGAAPSSDSGGNIFVATSDGNPFDPTVGGYPETLLKLQITTGFTVADSFTPWNEASLNLAQKYFGSTGVVLLPNSAGGPVPLAIAGSQAGSLYLLDRDNLGGFNGPNGPDRVVQTLCLGASLTGTPAFWANNNTVYVAAAGDSLKAFPLMNGAFTSPTCPTPSAASSQSADSFSFFGASPAISSNGSLTGIVWALDTSGYVTGAPAILRAYDATNLANRLYESSAIVGDPQAAGMAVKFAVPTVANGKLYVGTATELSVFGLAPQ